MVRLNMATEPSWVSGSQNEIAAMLVKFSQDYVIPPGLETTATAAALFTPTERFTAPSDD